MTPKLGVVVAPIATWPQDARSLGASAILLALAGLREALPELERELDAEATVDDVLVTLEAFAQSLLPGDERAVVFTPGHG